MDNIHERLADYFPPEKVHWRVGSTWEQGNERRGIALAYIDARDVMERLDTVVGFSEWQDDYQETPSGRIICRLSIRIIMPGDGLEWVTKSDGAGDTGFEGAKGAISDAFKRAAVKWGIGRYLYDLPTVRTPLTKRGNSWVLPKDFNGKQYLPCFQSPQMKTKYLNGLKAAAADDDDLKAKELWHELTEQQKQEIWTALGPESSVRAKIKELLKV